MTSEITPSIAIPSISSESSDFKRIHRASISDSVPSSSSSSSSTEEDLDHNSKLQRPRLGSRKTSGTMIVPRETLNVEMSAGEEEYDEGDARCMSPKRSDEELERLETGVRESLVEQAKQLQASLLALVEQVERMRDEHEKLEGGNRFLQSYIGELMSTSRITSTGGPKFKRGKAIK